MLSANSSTLTMMQRTSTPPNGPRGRTNLRGSTGAQVSHRGGIQKRRGAPRLDKDGDLSMDSPGLPGPGDRSKRGRGRGDLSSRSDSDGGRGLNGAQHGPSRGIFAGAAFQKAIARGLAGGDANIKGPNQVLRMEGVVKEAAGNGKKRDRQNGLEQIRVIGLRQSKASANIDGGVKDLLAFLERKATGPDAPGNEAVRIRKSRPEGDAMIISVRSEDAPKILRLNTFMFAGTQLQISRHDGPLVAPDKVPGELSRTAVETRQRLTEALLRRYDPATKLLDLSALGKDPQLDQMGTINRHSTTSKLFAALMLICDEKFFSAQEKQEAIVSVSLADNELRNISMVTVLAQTFPDLRNLDLSNNKLENMSALGGWRWRFRKLDHLVLTGNPIERVEPGYKEDVMRWYPSLRMLNGVQVRSDQEVASLAVSLQNAAKGKIPIPIRPALFLDEGKVAENFLRQFLPAYDHDRASLVTQFYDEQSTFSFNVNTSAPRAAQQAVSAAGGDDTKRQMWDSYIKKSRNLMKITHLAARMSRAHVGVASIQQCWAALPATRHPDLFTEGHKWLIECHPVPGIPDPTRQVPGGVGGLVVMVHGEFDELDMSTGATMIKRSFDRTFVLGPGGRMGIRVLNDLLTYRAYGGSEAWIPEEEASASMVSSSLSSSGAVFTNGLVPGMTDHRSAEQVQKEMMVMELSQRTGMTLEYSTMCLEEKAYVFDEALAAFESVKANLPPQAFL